MRRLLAFFVLAAAVPSGAATLEERLAECQEANADCKEDCTTSYGSSFKLREKLGLCLNKCAKRNNDCRGRHEELDQAGIDEDSYDRKRPVDEAMQPRKRTADVPSVPRQRPRTREEEADAPPEVTQGDDARQAQEDGEQSAAEQPPARETPAAERHTTRRAEPEVPRAEPERAAPTREERPAPPPPSPSRTAARKVEPASEDEGQDAPPPREDEDASREGAKKLMKKGIEEWDPSGE